jgi:hypothetical protein
MSRNHLVFGDIEGKLTCSVSSAPSAAAIHHLIEKHSRKGNMMK